MPSGFIIGVCHCILAFSCLILSTMCLENCVERFSGLFHLFSVIYLCLTNHLNFEENIN